MLLVIADYRDTDVRRAGGDKINVGSDEGGGGGGDVRRAADRPAPDTAAAPAQSSAQYNESSTRRHLYSEQIGAFWAMEYPHGSFLLSLRPGDVVEAYVGDQWILATVKRVKAEGINRDRLRFVKVRTAPRFEYVSLLTLSLHILLLQLLRLLWL